MKKSWNIIKEDVLKVFHDFFESGVVNYCVNETYICLIPKKERATRVADYRPINLVTSLYKVIAKVLARKLREVLEWTVSKNQYALLHTRKTNFGSNSGGK